MKTLSFQIPDELFESPMIVTSIDSNNIVRGYACEFVDLPVAGGWQNIGNSWCGDFKLTLLDKLQIIATCLDKAKQVGVPIEFLFNRSPTMFWLFWRQAEPFK